MKHPLAGYGGIILAVLALPALGSGQEWTRFRGPNGSGVSAAKGIPTVWTDNDINWKAPLPGPGHSSPVLWGDRIFLTTGDASTNRLWLLCLSAQGGQVVWQEASPIKPLPPPPVQYGCLRQSGRR